MAEVTWIKAGDIDLMVDLTAEELALYARQLAAAAEAYDEVDERRADVAKDFKEQLQNLRGEIRRLARLVRSKKEKRSIACSVAFHTPVSGTKTIMRTDTGEVVREEAMTETEMQERLFEDPPQPSGKAKAAKGPRVN